MRRIRTDLFVNGMVQSGIMVASLGLYVLLARSSSASDYGLFQFWLACGAIGAALCRPWSNVTIAKACYSGNISWVQHEARIALSWGAIALSAGAAVGASLLLAGSFQWGIGCISLGLYAVVAALEKSDAALQGLRMSRVARLIVLGQAVASLAFVSIAVALGLDLWHVCIALAAIRAASALAGWRIFAKASRTLADRPNIDLVTIRAEGRKNASNIAATEALAQTDRIALGHMDTAECAIYSVAVQIPRRIADSARAVLWSFCGELGSAEPEKARKLLRRYVPTFLALGTCAAVAIVAAAPYIYPLIYGSQYAAAVGEAQIAALLLVGAMASQSLVWYSLYREDGAWARWLRAGRQIAFSLGLLLLSSHLDAHLVIVLLVITESITLAAWLWYFRLRTSEHSSRGTAA